MTQTAAFEADDLEPATAEPGGRLRETVVQVSIVIVIVAFGVAMRKTFGFSVMASIAWAIGAYWSLLLVHALARRGFDIAELNAEMAELADQNANLRRLMGRRPSRGADSKPRLGRLAVDDADRADRPAAVQRTSRAGPAKEDAPQLRSTEPPGRATARAPSGGAPDATAKAAVAGRPTLPTQPRTPLGAAEPPAQAGNTRSAPPPLPSLGGPGGDRKQAAPRDAKAAQGTAPAAPRWAPGGPRVPIDPKTAAALGAAPVAPAAAPADPRAQDVAIMQSLIKGLADQLKGPTAPPARPQAPSAAGPAAKAVADVARAPDEPDLDRPLQTVDDQVGALRNVASALRAGPDAGAANPVARPERGVIERMAGAVDAARIDVYLDPILGLGDRKPRHFEVSVQLRDDDGELLDPRDFADAIAGTGLVPRIEAHTVTETVRIAGHFAARGANAPLFTGLSGESIRNGGFHHALAGALAPDTALASRLVMSVAQSEIRAFGPAHWEALDAMAQAGLRYALVDVVDLDADFEGLKRYGFDFVRLDAQVFLDGLPAPHGVVPAADLCRYLSQLGFSLIVGRITDERELVKVFGFGALLGQGRLFGGPRPIKVERSAAQTSAA